MLHAVTPSLSVMSSQPSTSKGAESSSSAVKDGPAQLDFEEELRTRSRNLSSTLHKLYLWEKKLYNEVKVCLLAVTLCTSTVFGALSFMRKLDFSHYSVLNLCSHP